MWCSLVPFWLKSTLSWSATSGGMGQGVASEPFPVELAFGVAVIWLIGLSCGLIGVALWNRLGYRSTPTTSSPVGNWLRITTRCLHFLRRRRLVSLAFGNYRNTSLGKAKPRPGSSGVRRRATTPGPKQRARVLHEGPAISQDGPDRSGVDSNGRPGRR